MDVSVLNPQILPGTPLKRDEHRKIGVIAIIVVILAVIFGVIYWLSIPKTPVAPTMQQSSLLKAQQALLLKTNPPTNLTSAEITANQKVVNKTNPPSKLTPEQVKSRQALLSNI